MSWIKKAIFLLIGIFSSLLLGLLVLELIFGNWLRHDKWADARQLNIILKQKVTYRTDNLYGSRTPTVTYSRDQFGLRSGCPDPKDIEILTIGGSTTDQRYINDGDTWQDALQRALNERLQRRICVANAGVDGHSTFGHIASFDRWLPLIPNLRPKYYLLYIGINDAGIRWDAHTGFDTESRPRGESELKRAVRHNSALYRLYVQTREALRSLSGESSQPYARYSEHRPGAADYTAHHETSGVQELIQKNTLLFSQRLSAILQKIRENGGTAICVSQPHLLAARQSGQRAGVEDAFHFDGKVYNGLDYQLSISSINQTMRLQCPAGGGYYVDLAAKAFEPEDFYDSVHSNPQGAARVGRYLFEALAEQGITDRLK